MTEEQRERYLGYYDRIKSNNDEIAQKEAELASLESNYFVQKYLKLQEEIGKLKNASENVRLSDIIGACDHEVYVLYEQRETEYGGLYMKIYNFACLDCGYRISINAYRMGDSYDNRDLNEFCKKNQIIIVNDEKEYLELQKEYFSDLLNMSSERAKELVISRKSDTIKLD